MKVKGKHEFEATPVVNGNALALANQVSAADHAHGNITNDGKVGSSANLPLITGADGIVTAGSFGTDANSFCQGNDARLSDARTPTAHNHDGSDVNSGTLDAARIPTLDAAKIGTGVLDIARIPAAAIERMVPVVDQTARFALTTNEVQLGDTVKQLDTGIMYVVIDTANLANAAGYAEYTAATAAAVPWSGVQSKPTTLSGYGITDAATSTHIHGNVSNAGAIGSTSGLAVVTGTSGVLTTGTVAVASGGTGATTAAGALTNLGLTATAAELNILDGVTGVTAAELSYVGDVTSAIQAQLNGKATSTHVHGNITNAGAIGTTADLPIVTSTSGIVAAGSWYASTPATATTTGTVGTSTSPARGDHAHPSRIATSAPASPVNGDIWMV